MKNFVFRTVRDCNAAIFVTTAPNKDFCNVRDRVNVLE